MTGRVELSAQRIAALLAGGAKAKVVGGDPLKGLTPTIWVDENEILWVVSREGESAPGVLVTAPDPKATALFVTVDVERARALLARAEELVVGTEEQQPDE